MALAIKGGSSCSIFVGNVPYDAQEEELKEIFSRAGQVRSVRVVCCRDTRQPKGYAFCDFADSASVQVAIEKLNNVEYNGRRLRVDGAERELSSVRGAQGGVPPAPPGRGAGPGLGDPLPLPAPIQTVHDKVAEMREKEALEQARAAATDAAERAEVARLMETLSPLQLLHIVGSMQRLAVSAPEVARALVGENAQLALALQHAEFLVGLLEDPSLPTDAEVKERAKSVREKLWQGGGAPVVPPPPSTAPKAGAVPAVQVSPQIVGLTAAAAPLQGHALGTATAFGAQGPQQVMFTASVDPRATAAAMQAQTAVAAPVAAPVPPGGMPAGGVMGQTGEDRHGLLQRLASLSPAQIEQLPHDQKVQLLGFLQTLPAA